MIRPPARLMSPNLHILLKKRKTEKKGGVREERSGTAVFAINKGAFTFALKWASKKASSISDKLLLLPAIADRKSVV